MCHHVQLREFLLAGHLKMQSGGLLYSNDKPCNRSGLPKLELSNNHWHLRQHRIKIFGRVYWLVYRDHAPPAAFRVHCVRPQTPLRHRAMPLAPLGLAYHVCFTSMSSHDIHVKHTYYNASFRIGRAPAVRPHRDQLRRCPQTPPPERLQVDSRTL
jgi:hypothetical protein